MNFTKLADVPNPEKLIEDGIKFKQNPFQPKHGEGKSIICLFFNPSLRTRLSTQKAAANLGMQSIILDVNSQGWALEFGDQVIMNGNKAEHIKEAAAVISSYCDIVALRSFPELKDKEKDASEFVLSQFMKYCSVPVISLESCLRHPLQSLADCITIKETAIKKPKIVVSWAPHIRSLPQAVTNSFLEWTQVLDANVVLTHPKGYQLSEEFSQHATFVENQEEAFQDADFVYVKNWSQVEKYGAVSDQFNDWIIDEEKMKLTKQGKMMHCLPIRRNVVATDNVLDNHSIVLKQAENRVYAAQSVIYNILENNK